MPQFIKGITSVSHSLLCRSQINWRGPTKRQAGCCNQLKAKFFFCVCFPEKQHVMQKVHTDVCWSCRIQWKVWRSGEGLKNAGGGFVFCFFLFFLFLRESLCLFWFFLVFFQFFCFNPKSMGLTQSYEKGRLIHKVAGAVKPEEWQAVNLLRTSPESSHGTSSRRL